MSLVRKAVAAVLHGAALTVALSGAAHAQQAADQGNTTDSSASGGVQALEEITVTGSRIKRTTDFDTANPTTVVDSSYLKNLGIVNVGAAITQLPSNISTNTPTTTGKSSFFTGSTIANLRGLNPYFGSRTLTMVNTRRFVPTNQGDGVDVNFIPSILIDHIDTVTGGASAAYGSGAVAGVQNIFLNTKLEGGRADVDYQQSSHSDAKDKHVAVAFGHGFADGRGHFVFGGEYEDMDAVDCDRDFCDQNKGFFQNTSVPGTYLYGDNLRKNMISDTGVLQTAFAGANSLYQGNAAGTGATVFNLGLAPYGATGTPQNVVPGGDGDPIYKYTNLRAPVDRKVATGTFNFALTDTLNLSVDASYGRVETTNYTAAVDSSFVGVTPANPFAAPVLAQAGNAGFALVAKSWNSQVDSFTRFTTTVKRASVGLDGKFGDSSWSWDGYYQIGRTNREQLVHDNLHNNASALALDAAVDPVSGKTVCAAQLNPGAPQYAFYDPALISSCVPVNIFGTQALTAAQHGYLFGNLDERLIYTQQVAAVNASGTVFEGWGAGEIQGAVGYEHRDELGHNLEPNEPAYVRTDYLIQYGEPFSGDVKVDEAYVETSIPVMRDLAFAKKVSFDLAARESKYRNQGLAGTTGLSKTHNLTTWKISGLWDVVDTFRFRGSQSRDSRAGNFRELYYGQKIGAGGLFGYCGPTGTFQTDACNWSLEGNPDLRPEKSDTTTFGFVWSPEGALQNLQLSVDYFRIRIQDAIQQANVRDSIDGCQQRNDPAACALLTFDGSTYTVNGVQYNGISTVRALATNAAGYMFKGLDFSGSYNMQLNNGANLSFRLLAENMFHQVFQLSATNDPVDVVGQTGTSNTFLNDNQPQPKWTGSLTSTYQQGPASVTAQMRFVGKGTMDYNYRHGVDDAGLPVIPVTTVASYQVFSLSGMYTFENMGALSELQLFGVVDNLFDKQPPFAAGITAFGTANNFGGTNATYFDTLGRMYRVGLRMNF
jgi:outer membrane receptor protein involved in Fe transport